MTSKSSLSTTLLCETMYRHTNYEPTYQPSCYIWTYLPTLSTYLRITDLPTDFHIHYLTTGLHPYPFIHHELPQDGRCIFLCIPATIQPPCSSTATVHDVTLSQRYALLYFASSPITSRFTHPICHALLIQQCHLLLTNISRFTYSTCQASLAQHVMLYPLNMSHLFVI